MSITTRQKQLLDLIEQFLRQEGIPPSIRDMCSALGLVSPGSLLRHLRILESQGYLTRIPGKKRTWKPANLKPVNSIPLLGRIAAGQPILAEQHVEDNLPFDPKLFGSSDAFALTVKGDSMVGLQIRDGDIAIIRPQEEVEIGEITAVIVEGMETEATLKVFYRKKENIELHAANPVYKPLVFKGKERAKIRILGKLVGVVRLKP